MHSIHLCGFQVGWFVTMADDKAVGTHYLDNGICRQASLDHLPSILISHIPLGNLAAAAVVTALIVKQCEV